MHPAPGPEASELVVPSRFEGSPTDFALEVYKGIQMMQTKSYPEGHLVEIRQEREEQAHVRVIKQLQYAKSEQVRRAQLSKKPREEREEKSNEELLKFRSPREILGQLVALLPPLSEETIKEWALSSAPGFPARQWPPQDTQ